MTCCVRWPRRTARCNSGAASSRARVSDDDDDDDVDDDDDDDQPKYLTILPIHSGLLTAEGVEESKRKITAKIKDLQESLDSANTKIAAMEKNRARAMGELDDAQV